MNNHNINEWVTVALYDSDTVDLLIKEKGHAIIIIYHIHQCIEKLLKALLVKADLKMEKSHNIDKLLSELMPIFPDLEELKTGILEIHLYLPKLRYPYGDTIEFEEANDLYSKFLIIKNNLLKKITT